MCIICEMSVSIEGVEAANDFLRRFRAAGDEMRAAEEALLRTVHLAETPEVRKRLDMAHKMMVRLRRDWNRIEHTRQISPEKALEG